MEKQKIAKGCATISALGVFLLIFSVWNCSGEDDNSEVTERKTFSKLDALSMSQMFVKDKLKSPSTAEFKYGVDQVTKLNDSTFEVSSYVDSQNSFGAQIRTNYYCKFYFDQDETAHLIDIEFD